MKLINDIRLFRSPVANIDGNPLPSGFACKELNIIIHRIVMKLREYNFSLGEFDHLYINFTTCLDEGVIILSRRSVDPYHRWYRYYDIGISEDAYQLLESEKCFDFIIKQLQTLLISFFAAEKDCFIKDCISEAVDQGEDMLMLYKTKQTQKLKASIFLQYLNNGQYLPHLFVWNCNGEEILHEKLAVSKDLMAIGEIQLSSKRVTVKPRKNSFSSNLSPCIFEL